MDELALRRREARVAAIEYLSYGAKTSGKIRQKLLDKGFAPELVEAVLRDLDESGYIRDEQIIAAYWRQRGGGRRESLRAFLLRMQRLGASRAALQRFRSQALEECASEYDFDRAALKEYLRARHGRELALLSEEGAPAERSPLAGRLMRAARGRGFSQALIADFLRRPDCALQDEDE